LKIINRRQIRVKVLKEIYSFKSGNYSSVEEGQKKIINSFTQTNTLYLFYLNFFKSFWEFLSHRDNFQKRFKKSLKPVDENLPLITGLIPFKTIAINKGLISRLDLFELKNYWKNKDAFFNEFYLKIVDSVGFKDYLSIDNRDFQTQLNLLIHIFKEILVHDKRFVSYIEDENIYWIDDIPIINTFFLRLIKTLDKKSEKEFNFFVNTFTYSKKDTDFALNLFERVLENSEKLDQVVQNLTLNWDVERIATIDRIIIKMSIAEIKYLSDIPRNVSVNEYIEISKEYSTPKSSQFINGVLDNILKNNY
tara:strand:- start:2828 stop:3748 length:921 start_codon:yes stop_codon:yes gene_type:complete